LPFSSEDKALIKNSYQFKKYGSRRILVEFSKKNCKWKGLDILLKKIWEAGSIDQRYESGKPKHMRTEENVTTADELAGLLSQ